MMAGCRRSLILDQTDMNTPADLIRHAIEHEGYGATTLAPAFLARILPLTEPATGGRSRV
ncbi:hypothetical protein J2809_002583 [Arthrobacter pascens]|uniref:hypothetical protein n=1 Tax=Arthrobacter pascens TaxID=1677 RepID=UPI00285E33F3|nr:hypothetical protein [Arthrobacter pascens]MDR6558213.1 hypothetical protein [Arthrobacter pascens]